MRIYNGPVIAAGAEKQVETRRILIVLPSWVGDLVLATPALEAIRARFPSAHIMGLLKPGLSDVLSGSPWFDEYLYWDEPAGKAVGKSGLLRLAGRLRREPIDLAVAFPNSFRSALIGFLSGARRRYGYARQGRTLLLTDRLRAPRTAGRFKPTPMLDYYNRLVERVGTERPAKLPTLYTTPEEESRVDRFLEGAEVSRGAPIVVLNPGGQYGAAKCWLPERYARVADELHARLAAEILINVAPHERAIAHDIVRAMSAPARNLGEADLGLGGLKALVRRSALMITNDTGPRHFAIAFDVPVVTIFGPTYTEWTQTCYTKERIVRVDVDCGPCQLRVCPLDHRCMTRITEDVVVQAAIEMVSDSKPAATTT